MKILSPLAQGKAATKEQEQAAVPAIPNTIPIHADFVMGASIVPVGNKYTWKVGSDAVSKTKNRNVYVHVPMTKGGKARLKVDGRADVSLAEGDGAFISMANAGDEITFESVGSEECECVILDSD